MLQNGIRWRVGDGTCINIREDPWFPKPTTFKVRSREGLQETMVNELIDSASKTWNAYKIRAGFNRDDVARIVSIPLGRKGCSDRLVWHHTENRMYTVKSDFGMALGLMESGALGRKGRGSLSEKMKHNQVWNRIWSLEVPNKMKFIVLKCCNNALAVRRNLQRRHMMVDNVCGVCNLIDEMENHLFFQCELSHLFWFCSPLQLNSYALEGADFFASWENFCNCAKGKESTADIMQEFVFRL